MENPFDRIYQVDPMWVTEEELHFQPQIEELEPKTVPQSSSGFLD